MNDKQQTVIISLNCTKMINSFFKSDWLMTMTQSTHFLYFQYFTLTKCAEKNIKKLYFIKTFNIAREGKQ